MFLLLTIFIDPLVFTSLTSINKHVLQILQIIKMILPKENSKTDHWHKISFSHFTNFTDKKMIFLTFYVKNNPRENKNSIRIYA